jgi:hypothetical protein
MCWRIFCGFGAPNSAPSTRVSRRTELSEPDRCPLRTLHHPDGSQPAHELDRDFRYGSIAAPVTASTGPPRPGAHFGHRSPTRQRYSCWRRLGPRVPAWPRLVTSTTSSKDTATTAFLAGHRRPFECDNPSGWGPRELLDAPENLPKENWRQVALGQLPARRSGVPSLCAT